MKEEFEQLTDYQVCKKYVQLQQSAHSRGIHFDLSFNTVKRLMKQNKCYYTGTVFEQEGPNSRSFDRVDAKEGYVEGNVVVCTVDINNKKSNLCIEEIQNISRKINMHLKKKK
jgi:hypothetical protein